MSRDRSSLSILRSIAQPRRGGLFGPRLVVASQAGEDQAPLVTGGDVVGVHRDRAVEVLQRGVPVAATRAQEGQLGVGRDLLVVQLDRTAEMPRRRRLVPQLREVPPGTEVRGRVVRLQGQVIVVCGSPLGVTVGLAKLLGQAEAGGREGRVAPQRFAVILQDPGRVAAVAAVDLRTPEMRLGVVGEIGRPAIEDGRCTIEIVGLQVDACQCLVNLTVRRPGPGEGRTQRGLGLLVPAGLRGDQGAEQQELVPIRTERQGGLQLVDGLGGAIRRQRRPGP